MTYKATARSPHYGRIFAYDEKGQEIKEIDILKVKVVSQNKEYVIGDLLKRVIDLDARLPLIEEFAAQNGPVISNLTEKIDTMAQLVVILSAQVEALKLEVK